MSSGPQHYAEAERLTEAYRQAWTQVEAMSVETVRDSERRIHASDGARQLLVKAQVHATLALAAATADPALGIVNSDESQAWSDAVEPADPWVGWGEPDDGTNADRGQDR